jgi:hypothetical protein
MCGKGSHIVARVLKVLFQICGENAAGIRALIPNKTRKTQQTPWF